MIVFGFGLLELLFILALCIGGFVISFSTFRTDNTDKDTTISELFWFAVFTCVIAWGVDKVFDTALVNIIKDALQYWVYYLVIGVGYGITSLCYRIFVIEHKKLKEYWDTAIEKVARRKSLSVDAAKNFIKNSRLEDLDYSAKNGAFHNLSVDENLVVKVSPKLWKVTSSLINRIFLWPFCVINTLLSDVITEVINYVSTHIITVMKKRFEAIFN